MDRIEEAYGHLAGALMQAIPSDDQIIVRHMQEAHDLLKAELRERRVPKPRPNLSTVEKRNAFYNSDEYRNMTTAEKCAVQGDGFINDYD